MTLDSVLYTTLAFTSIVAGTRIVLVKDDTYIDFGVTSLKGLIKTLYAEYLNNKTSKRLA